MPLEQLKRFRKVVKLKDGTLVVLRPLAEDDGEQLAAMFAAAGAAGIGGAMLAVRMADASRYGTVSCDAGQVLTGFNEKKPGAGAINAGVYLFAAEVVERFPAKTPLSFETEVFPALINGGVRIKVCEMEAPFLDIGTPASLAQAEAFIQQNRKYFEDTHP